MKKKLLLLTLPLILAGCTGKSEPDPIDPPVIEEYDLTHKYEDLANDPDFEYVNTRCSTSGWFVEVNSGRCLATDSEYEFIFKASTSGDTSFTVKSSHEEHATAEVVDNTSFILSTHTAGDTIISVYDATGYLCYRNVVRVRPAQTEETILDVAFNADHFETPIDIAQYMQGSFNFTLLDNSEGSSVLSGHDDMESNFKVSFELDFAYYVPATELFCFECVNEDGYTANTYVSTVAFSKVGDVAYVYYTSNPSSSDEHLLTFLVNSDVEYIYE